MRSFTPCGRRWSCVVVRSAFIETVLCLSSFSLLFMANEFILLEPLATGKITQVQAFRSLANFTFFPCSNIQIIEGHRPARSFFSQYLAIQEGSSDSRVTTRISVPLCNPVDVVAVALAKDRHSSLKYLDWLLKRNDGGFPHVQHWYCVLAGQLLPPYVCWHTYNRRPTQWGFSACQWFLSTPR